MKRWLLFVLLFGLLFVAVMPVSAAGKGPRSLFNFAGKIEAIGVDTVTIQVLAGNNLVRVYVGHELTVATNKATRYLEIVDGITVPITLGELDVDDPVSVHGMLVDGVWTASRITVGAKLIHFP